MWEALVFAVGAVVITAGALSLLYPLRWIGIRTRGTAFVVIAAGFLVVALGAGMLDSYFVYLGFVLAVAGLISLLRPLRFLYIRTRRLALAVVVFGILMSVATALIPYGEHKSATAGTKLDEWMPRWQVGEKHAIEINAPPEKVFAAIHAVRADEIFLFRTLIAIRRCGTTGQENILNPPEEQPLLDVATRTTFIPLTNDAPREIVVGTVIAAPREVRATGKPEPDLFRKNLRSRVALAAMNFLVAPNDRAGSTVTTETRIYANTPAVLRRFGVYWRIIHPGSDLIRRMWLRAIAQRAERDDAAGR